MQPSKLDEQKQQVTPIFTADAIDTNRVSNEDVAAYETHENLYKRKPVNADLVFTEDSIIKEDDENEPPNKLKLESKLSVQYQQ